jgi:hypothetical protein
VTSQPVFQWLGYSLMKDGAEKTMDIALAKYAVTVTRYFNNNFIALVSYRLGFFIYCWFLFISLIEKAGFSFKYLSKIQLPFNRP